MESVASLRALAAADDVSLAVDDVVEPTGPLMQTLLIGGRTAENRFVQLPLEGWDADGDGRPTEQTIARWAAFGACGASILWTESLAVSMDARSSLSQIVCTHMGSVARLHHVAKSAHEQRFGSSSRVLIGAQLHHSGRLRVDATGARRTMLVRRHGLLDARYGADTSTPVVSDDELDALVADYVAAAQLCAEAGFDFVDVKACHGYLLHELLGAFDRPGRHGGPFENRTRLLQDIVRAIRSAVPNLLLAVRVSAFDDVAHVAGDHGTGVPWSLGDANVFGPIRDGSPDLSEPIRLAKALADLGVAMIGVTGGSPYSTWHVQRPAWSAGTSGYDSPEPLLRGIARHLDVTAALRRAVPAPVYVAGAMGALGELFPNVAQAAVRRGAADSVGFARLHLADPDLVARLRRAL